MIEKCKSFARRVAGFLREHTRHSGLVGMCILLSAVTMLFVFSINIVSISDGNKTHTLYTLKTDIRGILGYAGYTSEYNVVGSNRDGNKLSIKVNKSFPVHITYGDETITYVSSIPSSIEDILINAEIEIKEDDMVTPALDTVVDSETYVDIVLAPKKETQVKQNTVSVSASTNVSVSKPVSSKSTISTLTPDIDIELDENGIPVNYKKATRVQATAYTYTGNRCATGVKPQPGYIAVNPKVIPYGTKMYIVSADGKYVYGYAIAADTGGFIKSRPTNVDLFLETQAACKYFGRRDIIIYFL